MRTETNKQDQYSREPLQRRGRIRWAQQQARILLRKCAIQNREDLSLQTFTDHLGVEVMFCRHVSGDAELIRYRDKAFIHVSEHLEDVAIRFAIAHELGHLVLGHPGPIIVGKWKRYSPEHEAEANAFASELLMPRMFLRDLSHVREIDLELARTIERDFNVSILTAAIRVTELSRQPCGAVLSKDGRVRWFARSETMPFRIESGTLLSCDSIASHFFVESQIDEEPRRIPLHAWSGRGTGELVEHAQCSRRHGTVLSMLWVPEQLVLRREAA